MKGCGVSNLEEEGCQAREEKEAPGFLHRPPSSIGPPHSGTVLARFSIRKTLWLVDGLKPTSNHSGLWAKEWTMCNITPRSRKYLRGWRYSEVDESLGPSLH